MNMKSNKLKTAVMASVLALSVNLGINSNAEATYILNFNEIKLDSKFILQVSHGNPDSYETHTNLYQGYLLYTPTDMNIYSNIDYDGNPSAEWGKLEGGKLYFIYQHNTHSNSTQNVKFAGDGLYVNYYGDTTVTTLGNAADILGEGGMSEEDIKDLVNDAIHKVDGDQTVDGNQQVTGEQTVNGGQTVTGGQTVNGDSTTNGNSTTTGNSTIKGDNNTEGDSNVEGDSNIGGDLNVDGDGTVDGDMNVGYEGADEDGDGTPDRPGDLNVAGNTNTEGNETVKGDSSVEGDSNVGGNQNVAGDSTIEGNSTVKGDSFVEGNQDVTGDSHIGGNETVDGNETVKGDSFVEGNGHFDGNVSIGNRDENGNATDSSDLDVTGNGNFGGDVNIGHDGVDEDGDGTPDRPGNLDVAGDSHLTGDTQVGSRDDNGAVVDRSDLDVTGNANLGGDTYVGFDGADSNGDGVVDRPGNMYIAGDTVIGVPGVPGAESNLHVTGNTTIDHDLYVGGEGHFDGNLYAPDLIFNGGKSLTGEISRLDGRIDTAGANAAALAGLHPLDFDEDQKLNFAAAVGSYQGASAMALGMFYRPDDRTMFNLGGTFGNRENMATLGISFALDGPNAVSRSSKKKMQEQIVQLTAANAVMAENNAKMQTELEELKAMVMELKAEKAA